MNKLLAVFKVNNLWQSVLSC